MSFILSSADFFFFKINFFQKILSGTMLECQTVSIRRPVGPHLGPNCLQRLSADDKVGTNKERVSGICEHNWLNTVVLWYK